LDSDVQEQRIESPMTVPDEEFDFRLVDGRTINSAELASANKPVFYFFFATW